MRSLFRRKSATAVVDETVTERPPQEAVPEPTAKGRTPSKKELGVVTPKRPSNNVRRGATATPTDRREAGRKTREDRRERRREVSEGMRRGDPRYLLARDRGSERALVRDIVDSRRTAGTWFFAGALIVLIGSSTAMPDVVRLVSNILWLTLAFAVILDSVLICRRVRSLVRERFPRSEVRMRSLYLYAVMRGITFRRLRVPQPRVELGDAV